MKNLKSTWIYFIAIIMLIFIAFQCKRASNLKLENLKDKQNIEAAKADMNVYKTKQGAVEAEKSIWILSEKDLKKQNKDLYDLVNNQKGTIISLNNSILDFTEDTTVLHDSLRYLHTVTSAAIKINKSEWKIPWELDYNWDSKNYDIFKGHTIIKIDSINNLKVIPINTEMDYRKSQIDLTFGEKVVGGKYNVFIESKYPGFTPESMTGVLIDPNSNSALRNLIKKKRWFTGFSISIGISPAYDFINSRPAIVIGPSFGYSIYQW